ncbi:MAG TPA: formimidoylglutamase, partial [Parapedobacter sp.]|nr:formimidoylglutamase [Parapedobacter sp.]
ESAIAILGFACDEGIKRNQGRIGAAGGPEAIRKALSTLPVFHPDLSIYDAGDIYCPGGELEIAQQQLALAVVKILRRGAFPILLGGGHEITYGHYCGINAFLKHQQKRGPGVINFDAHFDNREVTAIGPTSGTGFWQIAMDCKRNGEEFRYLALGVQKTSNTPYLFETARHTDTSYVLARQFDGHYRDQPSDLVERFSRTIEQLYVTIDLDVFAAPYAPGVSAPAHNGIRPDTLFFDCLEKAFTTGKLVSLDIAELNPAIDIDGRTARLAATIIFHAVSYLSETRH